MKNLSNFEAFRLGKSQMAKVSGGVTCQVHYSDGMGGSFVASYQTTDADAMEKELQKQHPDGKADCWT